METNSLSFRYFLCKESDYSIMAKETYADRLGKRDCELNSLYAG